MWGLFVALGIIVLEFAVVVVLALLISGLVSWAANGFCDVLKHLKWW